MMIRQMSFAAASAASVVAASMVSSSPAATPLAVASRPYTCGQGMGAAGTSVARPRPEPGLSPVHRDQCLSSIKIYFLNIKVREKAI